MAAVTQYLGDTITYLPHIVASSLCWTAIYYASPAISQRLSSSWAKLKAADDKRTLVNWDMHVVSQFHCIPACIMAIMVMADPALHGLAALTTKTQLSTFLLIFSCGYFLWDTVLSIKYLKWFGPGFLLHGVICFILYGLALRPFLNFYAGLFLLFELSTPFLNNNWFMDKCEMTGSKLQLVNGVLTLLVFFGARIAGGFYYSYTFQREVGAFGDAHPEFPRMHIYIYRIANVIMCGLNAYWFHAMIDAVRRRMQPDSAAAKHAPDSTGKQRTKTN